MPHADPPETSLIVVAGPTGAGKSALAIELAMRVGGEVVNFDSVQIYRGFDIGSAKPTAEERSRVPHHLFDIVDASDEFTAADYAARADAACATITMRGRVPVFVGGTFFYLRALLSGLPEMPGRDPELRRRIRSIAATDRGRGRLHRWLTRVDAASGARISPADTHRVERALEVYVSTGRPISGWRAPAAGGAERYRALKIALQVARPQLVEELDRRVDLMYERGLVEETRELMQMHPRASRPFQSIGYKEAVRVLEGELTLEDATVETKRRTRAYAKRQMTWLRAERQLHWLDRTLGLEANLEAALELWKRH